MPQPDVDSAILRLVPKKALYFDAAVIPTFEKVIRAAFATRRKTILNNLQRVYSKEKTKHYLEKIQIAENMRPEQMSVLDYSALAQIIYDDQQSESGL